MFREPIAKQHWEQLTKRYINLYGRLSVADPHCYACELQRGATTESPPVQADHD